MSWDRGSTNCILSVYCVHGATAQPEWAWRRKGKKGGDGRKELKQLQARGWMDLCAPAEKGSLSCVVACDRNVLTHLLGMLSTVQLLLVGQ